MIVLGYASQVKPPIFFTRPRKLIAVCLLLAVAGLETDAKEIRLRNGSISTSLAAKIARQSKLPTNDAAVSGLFLIQFTGPIQSEWREQLSALRVDLLRYVPDDTFV